MKKTEVTEVKKIVERLVILKPNMKVGQFKIVGTAPLVQHKFSAKARMAIKLTHEQKDEKGDTATAKKPKKAPRNFKQEYLDAMHVGEDGKQGFPCTAIRAALIRACSTAGYVMTKAKMSLFCLTDTLDAEEGVGLFYFKGKPEQHEGMVRLAKGVCSIAVRPMYRVWSATLNLKWDDDQFHMQDVVNLLIRAGETVGIGEGRPFSKDSSGNGWGTFRVLEG